MASRTRYEPARRLAQVRDALDETGGLTIYDIAERFDVSVVTALRYIRALEVSGAPLFEELSGRRKVWKLMPTARANTITVTTSQLVSLLLSRRVFDFLAGTGFAEDLDDVFRKLESTLHRKDPRLTANLDRKVFDINEAPHQYEGRVDHVNQIVTAVLREERLRVLHERVDEGKEPFLFDPYSIVVYKKGLYVAGYSHRHAVVRPLSLDAFLDVDWLRGDRFAYPADYDPAKLFEGSFGIFRGPATRVRIRFTEKVARYVTRRRWHPSQQIVRRRGGAVELVMDVRGTTELTSFVLGFGDQAEVLEPAELRQAVVGEMQRAIAAYAKSAKGAATRMNET